MTRQTIAKPLWIKISSRGFAAVLLSSLIIGGLALKRQYDSARENLETQIGDTVSIITADIEAQKRVDMGLALSLAGEPDMGTLIVEKKREELSRRFGTALPAMRQALGLGLMTFSDNTTTVVARIHDPKSFGEAIGSRRPSIAHVIETGTPTSALELGRTALTVFASAPVIVNSHVVGVVDIGTPLTHEFFNHLKQTSRAEIAVLLKRGDAFETQSATAPGQPYLAPVDLKAITEGGSVRRDITRDSATYAVTGIAMKDFRGATIGVLEIAADISAQAKAQTHALWSTTIATIAVCVVALWLFLVFARGLARSISGLTTTMDRLALGELEAEIRGQASKDEIGAMARAVQVFKDAAIEKRRLEQEAAATRAASEAERHRSDRERAEAAAEQAAVVGGLAASLGRLADGDLTCGLDQRFAPAYERLRTDFNRAVAQLRDTVRIIASNSGAIRSGTGEIAVAADDFSRRTEQQAASLEETAASLGQITDTMRRTAEGAAQASATVNQARDDAERSGVVVRDTVAAMGEIETSSRHISQIIGVIDEIAFQTSLLALNAGVEAARAGDAGRGFAVVASEVRGLAQRSAEAAKEIKGLIATSSRQVERGVALVDETGRALARIVVQVTDISAAINTIATAAEDQATGLAEINAAVAQMDKVTQQNAAMMEESTAASHALSQEADALARLTGRFRLDKASGTFEASSRAADRRRA